MVQEVRIGNVYFVGERTDDGAVGFVRVFEFLRVAAAEVPVVVAFVPGCEFWEEWVTDFAEWVEEPAVEGEAEDVGDGSGGGGTR